MPGDRTPLWARPPAPQDRSPVDAPAPDEGAAAPEFRRAEDPAPALAASARKTGTGADDRFIGDSRSDTLIGRAGEDTLKGRGGDDLVRGGGAGDRLIGGGGRDRVIGGGGDDLVKGGGGGDLLKGGGGNDRLFGGGGSDTLIGGKGDDTLNGGGRDDTFVFTDAHLRDGVKTILGFSSGVDRIDLSGVSGLGRFDDIPATRADGFTELAIGGAVIRVAGDAPEAADFIVDDPVEFARPSASSSALSAAVRRAGSGEDDSLDGTGDSDVLIGRGGADTLKGRGGDDTLKGGGGDDVLRGGGGDDVLRGGGGGDRLFGGGANDRVIGGGGDDVLKGNGGDDFLKGGGGDDRIAGGGGSDTLIGDKGEDTLIGGGGDDIFVFDTAALSDGEKTILRFRSGADKIDLSGVSGVSRFADIEIARSGGTTELRVGGGVISVTGDAPGEGDFIIRSGAGGGATADPFTGGAGDDLISSGPGNDLIRGLAGNDTLGAGAGIDTLEGGTGADVFVVRLVGGGLDGTIDVVRDFRYGEGDKVSLVEALSGVPFDRLDEVARATPTGSDTMIAVKRGATFQDVMRLEGVTFTTEQLISYGFKAPAGNGAFVDNPYGFANNNFATADPAATRDGAHVAWVDRQNLDGDPNDGTPSGSGSETVATRDVFILNTETGALQRVTLGSGSREATSPALSADGRFVAYTQEATGNSRIGDVFIRDMAFPDRAPIKVNVANDGSSAPGTPIDDVSRGGLGDPATESVSLVDISGDARSVVFVTRADLSGVGETDDNNQLDVYLRTISDLETGAGTTRLISGLGGAAQGVATPYPNSKGQGDIVHISEDGRYVAFATNAAFSGADTDGQTDIYLFDTVRGEHLLVSSPLPGGTTSFDMSADGSRIAFATAEAIGPGDVNGNSDIYLAEIDLAGFTVSSRRRVSEAEGGFEARDGESFAPVISQDGERVAFLSTARDLTPYDPFVSFESSGGFGGRSLERLYVADLATGALSVPDVRLAVADRDSVIAHAALTEDGIVVRQSITDTAPNSGRNGIGDSIATAGLIPAGPEVGEIPDFNQGGGGVQIERRTSVRSSIDSEDDRDVFFFRTNSFDNRDFSITIEGDDTNAGTLANPFVRVSVARFDNPPFASDDNSGFGRNAFVTVDASASNNYFIEVSSADGGLGSYRLTISDNLTPFDDIF